MSIPSPVRSSARLAMQEWQQTCAAKHEHAVDTIEASMAIPVCMFAGGPPAARVVAAASRAFHTEICRGWSDLQDAFDSRVYVVGGLDSNYKAVDTAERYDPLTDS